MVFTPRVVVSPTTPPRMSNQKLGDEVEACKDVRAIEKKLQKEHLPFPLST